MAKPTLETLAGQKLIDVELMRVYAEDVDEGVAFIYSDLAGTRIGTHVRTRLEHGGQMPWRLAGNKPVPFLLNCVALAHSVGLPLVIAEGETDALTLLQHGLPSIGLPGATMQSTISAEMVKAFPDRVLVATDNDEAGERCALTVAERLRELGYAGSVRRASPAPHNDVNAMYIALNGRFGDTWRGVCEHAAEIKTPEPKTKPDFTSRIKSFAQICAQPTHLIPWDIPDLLPSVDGPHLVFGAPGASKSWHLKHLCDVMTGGQRFLGKFEVNIRPSALYINVDCGFLSFENRIQRIGPNPNAHAVSLRGSEFTLDELKSMLAKHPRGFVVIDSLAAFYDPTSDDPARAMRDFFEGMQALYAEYECGGIIADHPHRPKDKETYGDYYGSVQKEATVRCMWLLAKPKDESLLGDHRRVHTLISCRKMSEGPAFARISSTIDFGPDIVTFTVDEGQTQAAPDPVEVQVIAAAKRFGSQAFTVRSILDCVSQPRARIQSVVDALLAERIFIRTGQKRNGGELMIHADFRHEQPLDDSLDN